VPPSGGDDLDEEDVRQALAYAATIAKDER